MDHAVGVLPPSANARALVSLGPCPLSLFEQGQLPPWPLLDNAMETPATQQDLPGGHHHHPALGKESLQPA